MNVYTFETADGTVRFDAPSFDATCEHVTLSGPFIFTEIEVGAVFDPTRRRTVYFLNTGWEVQS